MIEQDNPFPYIDKDAMFQVPTDFFEGLPERTLLLAQQRRQRKQRSRRLIRSVVLLSSAAAVFLLLTVVPPTKHRMTKETEKVEAVLQDLSVDDLTKMTVVYGSDMMDEQLSQENTY